MSTPFIHAVAPAVMNHLLALGPSRPADDVELTLTLEGVRMVETLTAAADDQSSKCLFRASVVPKKFRISNRGYSQKN